MFESIINFIFIIKSAHINKKLKLNIDLITYQNLFLPYQEKNNTFNDYLLESKYLNDDNITKMYYKYRCYNLSMNLNNIKNISDLNSHDKVNSHLDIHNKNNFFPITDINNKYSHNMIKKIENKFKNINLEEYYIKTLHINSNKIFNQIL